MILSVRDRKSEVTKVADCGYGVSVEQLAAEHFILLHFVLFLRLDQLGQLLLDLASQRRIELSALVEVITSLLETPDGRVSFRSPKKRLHVPRLRLENRCRVLDAAIVFLEIELAHAEVEQNGHFQLVQLVPLDVIRLFSQHELLQEADCFLVLGARFFVLGLFEQRVSLLLELGNQLHALVVAQCPRLFFVFARLLNSDHLEYELQVLGRLEQSVQVRVAETVLHDVVATHVVVMARTLVLVFVFAMAMVMSMLVVVVMSALSRLGIVLAQLLGNHRIVVQKL